MRNALLGAAFVLAAGVGAANAATLSFTGQFSQDDDVDFFQFTVDVLSNVTVATVSYAGGVLANGFSIPAGGFDPIVSLFDPSGALIASADDGGAGVDPTTGTSFDSFLEALLDPGRYTVAISQYDNFAGAAVTDPFVNEGDGDFTAGFCGPGEGPDFCDVTGDGRTNNYAFDITTAPIPLPASGLLALAGLGALAALRRRA